MDVGKLELRTCQDFLKEFRDEMPNPKIVTWTREVCVFLSLGCKASVLPDSRGHQWSPRPMGTNASKALKYFLEIADTDQICDQLLALKTLGRCWDGWLDARLIL